MINGRRVEGKVKSRDKKVTDLPERPNGNGAMTATAMAMAMIGLAGPYVTLP